MGVVHRAEHVESGRVVALKVSNAQHEASVESIRREAYGLSQLRHPGVVRVLGHGTRDGLPWIAMELLEGTTLYQHFQAMWDDLRPRGSPGQPPPRRRSSGQAPSSRSPWTSRSRRTETRCLPPARRSARRPPRATSLAR